MEAKKLERVSAEREAKSRTWLPVPLAGKTGPLSRSELQDYRDAQERHQQLDPYYAAGWQRPARPVAEAVWELLASAFEITMDKLLPASPPREYWDDDATCLTVKQAFMVSIDTAVRAGEEGTMLTINSVFDALAARWSDRYREVREEGRAEVSWDMS